LRYCTEFCADDADEAVFQKQRRLVAKAAGGARGA
jgi:hypothetical protein